MTREWRQVCVVCMSVTSKKANRIAYLNSYCNSIRCRLLDSAWCTMHRLHFIFIKISIIIYKMWNDSRDRWLIAAEQIYKVLVLCKHFQNETSSVCNIETRYQSERSIELYKILKRTESNPMSIFCNQTIYSLVCSTAKYVKYIRLNGLKP